MRRILPYAFAFAFALAGCLSPVPVAETLPTEVEPSAPPVGGATPDAGTSLVPADGGSHTFPVPTDGGLDLNDVSFLFPLPARFEDVDALLSMTASGARGQLLPQARLGQVLYSVAGFTDENARYASLHVVSVRVDPCFAKGPTGTPGCTKQIRLVAQPFVPGGAVPLLALDAPVHLLYELTDDAFRDVHRALFELKAMTGGRTEGQPLDVHPVMRAEGLAGAYAQKLMHLVRAHCGEANLVRIATMPLLAAEIEWRFAAVDVHGPDASPVVIPRLFTGTTVQQMFAPGDGPTFQMNLIPAPPPDGFAPLLDNGVLSTLSVASLRQGIALALTLENPERTVVPDVDCGSCHLATQARLGAERQPGVSGATYPEAFRAAPRFDLRRVSTAREDLKVMRAFGYFGATGAWSQRTINESARVAESLSTPP